MSRRPEEASTSLARILEERGIAMKKLSGITGIPYSTLAGVRLGGQRLSPERAVKVAEALDVPPSALADITGSKRGKDPMSRFSVKPKPKAAPSAQPAPQPAPAQRPARKLSDELERIWLHVHQLERRVAVLEDARREERR